MNEILASVSWSLIGFLLGWLVGREMLFISQIREAVVSEEERERTDHKVTPEKRSRLLGFIVVLLALLSVLEGAYYTWDTEKKTACQAHYNADFTKVVGLRAQWADDDKRALNKMLSDILGAAGQPGKGRDILIKYIQSTERTDKLRAENPLPKLEDRNC